MTPFPVRRRGAFCFSMDHRHRSSLSSYDTAGNLFGRQCGKRAQKTTTSIRPKLRHQLGPAHQIEFVTIVDWRKHSVLR